LALAATTSTEAALPVAMVTVMTVADVEIDGDAPLAALAAPHAEE